MKVVAKAAEKVAVKADAAVAVVVKVAVMIAPLPSAWTLATLTPPHHKPSTHPSP